MGNSPILYYGLFTTHVESSLPPCADEELHQAWESYKHVNSLFAEAMRRYPQVREDTTIMLQDYHIYLTPKMIRKEYPMYL